MLIQNNDFWVFEIRHRLGEWEDSKSGLPQKSVHLQKNSEGLKGALCQELKLLLPWRILGLKTKEVGNSSIINRWLLTRISWLKFRIAFSLYHVQYWVELLIWALELEMSLTLQYLIEILCNASPNFTVTNFNLNTIWTLYTHHLVLIFFLFFFSTS